LILKGKQDVDARDERGHDDGKFHVLPMPARDLPALL
jgi:hypothetical protein